MMMSRHLRRRVNFGCRRFGDFENEDFGPTFAQTPFQLVSTEMIMLTSHCIIPRSCTFVITIIMIVNVITSSSIRPGRHHHRYHPEQHMAVNTIIVFVSVFITITLGHTRRCKELQPPTCGSNASTTFQLGRSSWRLAGSVVAWLGMTSWILQCPAIGA